MLPQFFTKHKLRLIQLLVVGVLLSVVFAGLYFVNPKKLGTSVYTNTTSESFLNLSEAPQVDINPAKVDKYLTFEDSRLPFTFQYPSTWHLAVIFSKDRTNYSDHITLTSATGDFVFYIDSMLRENPDSQEAKDFVQTSPSNPYSIETRKYRQTDFEILEVQKKNLLVSKTGGTTYWYDQNSKTSEQRAASLVLGKTQFIYEQSGDEATSSLSIVRNGDISQKANTLTIKYQVVPIAADLSWQMYSQTVKNMLSSIQTKNASK